MIYLFAREGFRDIYQPIDVLFSPEAFNTITSYFPSNLIGATWRFMRLQIPDGCDLALHLYLPRG